MAKKINFSVKNEELIELEKISKQKGKKVVEIIRERYERGKKRERVEQKLNKIIDEFEKQKNEQTSLFFRLFSAVEILVKQNTISNEILTSILKGNLKEDEKIRSFQDIVSKKSEENIGKIKSIFYGN